MMKFQRILFPTDFSAASTHAFELACGIARDYNASILILAVIEEPLAVGEYAGLDAGFSTGVHAAREKMQAKLVRMKSTVPGVSVQRKVVVGVSATEQILSFAEREKCDLIVMGTHGRHGVTRILLGSVADEVVRKAPCPVLVIREAAKVSDEIPPAKDHGQHSCPSSYRIEAEG